MDHLLMLLVLLWNSGLQAEDKHQPTGSQCESTAKADIVLLLVNVYKDIHREDHRNIKLFLTQIVSNFNIGPDKVQIGLVQYMNHPWTEWFLNTHETKESLLEAVTKLQPREGHFLLGNSLRYILNELFSPTMGMRTDSKKIAILITNGESQDDTCFSSQHLKDTGIEIYTIGVGNANETQLRAIASDPDEIYMYSVSNFSFLLDIIDNLTINLCNNALDSVRLVNGNSLCSGRLEVKSEQSWSSVCEADFDQQDAEVVCRELGCGAPSVLQGALYGEMEAPMWTKEFQCGGNESALLDCGRSDSARSTCSPGKAVGLTCSEPVRLVGGASRCAGTLELKRGVKWKPVSYYIWTPEIAAAACKELDCGSPVSRRRRYEEFTDGSVWRIRSNCVKPGSALKDCASSWWTPDTVELICSDLLLQPIISVSSTMDGVSEVQQQGFQVRQGSNFTISCSVQPQYPGGSFQLTFTSSNTAHNYTQPAVNHSADFLFPAVDPAHQGSYSCIYGLYVFDHNFSSESRLLSLTVTDPTLHIIRDPDESYSRKVHIIRLVVLPVTLLLVVAVVVFILKASRGQRSDPQENIELDSYNLSVYRAEGESAEEEGAQGAE
ncbi:uncharacterized protein [Thunnus thynnus]|uniref:uncharacterized protein n=1 Tax=Thunnus thynnus TaxID=8237 RepID=UPI003528B425